MEPCYNLTMFSDSVLADLYGATFLYLQPMPMAIDNYDVLIKTETLTIFFIPPLYKVCGGKMDVGEEVY